ncbi:MAG: hypothetical protein O3A36_00870 [bacterium]|nr:hypothetical protein [bacterium]
MSEYLSIIALPSRREDVNELIVDASIDLAVSENDLPRLQFQAHDATLASATIRKRFSDKNGASAGFSTSPFAHVVLTEKFFSKEHVRQKFIFIHELRHAHQSLVSTYWKRYVHERLQILQTVPNKLMQDVAEFLSAPLEFDAQQYALPKFHEIGSATVASRTQEVRQSFYTFPYSVAATLPCCLEILPAVYQWARLIKFGVLLQEHEPEVKKNAERILGFLATHTRVGQNKKANELCDKYVVAEPDNFLRVAKDLYDHLLTLPD